MGSLIFVLALFFSNTVPALEERQNLTSLHHDLLNLRQQYEDAIDSAARLAHLGKGPENFDLQSLLVAMDQQGYTPMELDVIYRQIAKQRSAEESKSEEKRPVR